MKELNRYIEQMHTNFSQMLKKTLEKMKDRIKRAHDAWTDENENNLQIKFREIIDNG